MALALVQLTNRLPPPSIRIRPKWGKDISKPKQQSAYIARCNVKNKLQTKRVKFEQQQKAADAEMEARLAQLRNTETALSERRKVLEQQQKENQTERDALRARRQQLEDAEAAFEARPKSQEENLKSQDDELCQKKSEIEQLLNELVAKQAAVLRLEHLGSLLDGLSPAEWEEAQQIVFDKLTKPMVRFATSQLQPQPVTTPSHIPAPADVNTTARKHYQVNPFFPPSQRGRPPTLPHTSPATHPRTTTPSSPRHTPSTHRCPVSPARSAPQGASELPLTAGLRPEAPLESAETTTNASEERALSPPKPERKPQPPDSPEQPGAAATKQLTHLYRSRCDTKNS
ncbi:hypothetical protein LTS07_001541 [Exophiala sideris]|uniref:Uncharacterized protein n=1 Tax=Exophiala sideris TaxID=1016849 RepID=A0ABR0JNJ6_9EURO|nr:hypothetical protein LTS07_001541 [Exophiala sideris]KAK5044055.1 hypothetical protein LTR13_000411 [Exophiala sideris]KAK5067555.1 hypothetical protein LTR69_001544 [Exophiala sideris]KAK5184206.1 hypothetical protein LTR44_003712 [Eurotiomycetes sp. CCFEE 6388]